MNHIDFDIVGWIAARLLDKDIQFDLTVTPKVDDGLLHPSSHLGCEIAMCHHFDPNIGDKDKGFDQLMRLMTGTLWHAMMEAWWKSGPFDGFEAHTEVSAKAGLPKGWNGTMDLLLGDLRGREGKTAPHTKWQLFDYKTIAPNAMRYFDIEKPKPEHQWQTSCYWHAARHMGYDMYPDVGMLHIPLAPAPWGVTFEAVPTLQWIPVLPEDVVWKELHRRSRILKAYLKGDHSAAKPMERVTETKYNKKTKLTEEIVKPHWLTRYCDSNQCACANQATEVVAYHDQAPEVL